MLKSTENTAEGAAVDMEDGLAGTSVVHSAEVVAVHNSGAAVVRTEVGIGCSRHSEGCETIGSPYGLLATQW